MSLATCFRSLLALGLLAAARPAAAQTAAPLNTKIKVYLVGTFHFNSSDGDVIKGTKVDMSTPDKQRELDELVSKLQKTQADKVFVEWKQEYRQRFVDSTYALYRKGQREVGNQRDNNNEVVQIGYRLAKKLNRPKVYCADADGVFDYGAALDYAKSHGQEPILKGFSGPAQAGDSVGLLIEKRVKAIEAARPAVPKRPMNNMLNLFKVLNSPEVNQANMDGYLLTDARVGGGTNYAGADLGGDYFKRNVRIYTNLLRAVDVQRDKSIVLIIGQGHVSLLKSILRYNSLFEVAEILPLLEAK
ncbi:DUF5694 domain-containing protein [Hymenobacter sp. BT559]|uniref:DUF5694 domain-containing protein n=1 Tax=Hymenobacter sp. BT559 TaxID=2795729 RepID=UPI0018EDA686|nr:DUF5694 domain-containing protein [Hymenobacter sp. BT559]MBJ6143939.1 hypothetical protein [Hymenobacter sp. BT559]